MSLFTNHLGLILYEDAQGHPVKRGGVTQWFVNPALTYAVGGLEGADRITVPSFNPVGRSELEILALLAAGKAFVTDLGSIPKIAWSLGFLPSGPEAKAFVLHDWCYVRRGMNVGYRYLADGSLFPINYTRAQADDLLLEAMLVVGADPAKARTIHAAVHAFGGHAWGT